MTGHRDASGLRDAEQAEIAAVLAVRFRLDPDQQVHRPGIPCIIGEHACITCASAHIPAVEEPGIVRDLRPVPDPGGEQGRDDGVIPDGEIDDGDVVILRQAGHVGLRQPVLDQPVAVLQRGNGRDDGIRRDGPLDPAELDFQADIPVHGQAVAPDLDPVLLLPETQDGGGDDEIGGREEREDEPVPAGEGVIAPYEEEPGRRSGQLHEQRQGQRQQEEGQVNDGRIIGQRVDPVKLQRDPGVHHDAPEGRMDINGEQERGGRQDTRPQPQPQAGPGRAGALEQRPAHQVGIEGGERKQQIDRQYRAQ